MKSALITVRTILTSMAIAVFACSGCVGKDCNTGKSYDGYVPPSQGTLTYGQPPVSQPFGGGAGASVFPCMQAPDTCTTLSFGWDGGPLPLKVTIAPLRNGQVITLPSPDVTVIASLDKRYADLPHDAGSYWEDLTLVTGSLSVTVTLNNFDAHFDMRFTRPDGETVVIQNARAALLNATWTESTTCF